MALRLPLLTYLFFITTLETRSQEPFYTVPNNPFLRLIRDSRFDGCQFVSLPLLYNKKILDLSGTQVDNGQCPMIINGELFILIPSTGIVYKSTGARQADSVKFIRIDSTRHVGYNINAFSFAHENSIFNLGGYGYWHWNGQLRKFKEKINEWDIVPLNREIPVSNSDPGTHFWKSPKSNFLFTFSYLDGNEAVKPQRSTLLVSVDSVLKLDLKTTNWTVLGKLNPKIKPGVSGFSLRAGLDSGILVENLGILQYLNLLDNSISVSTDRELFQVFSSSGKSVMTWSKNDKLFYSVVETGYVDSVLLSSIKFRRTNEKIYETGSWQLTRAGYIGGVLILAILAWVFRRKIYKSIDPKAKVEIDKNNLSSPYTTNEVFTEVEKALLKLLHDNMTLRGSSTSTDEVNRILGVGNKSIDMQKRKRSDVIKAINEKYQLLNPGTVINLINRTKSGVDARLYEYTLDVDPEFLQFHGI